MKRRSASLQARHALVLLLAIAGAIPYGCHAVWSLVLGGGVQVLNVAILERSVRLALGGGLPGAAIWLVLFARMLLLFAAVLVLLGRVGVSPLPFTIGLFAILPAGLWHGLALSAARS